MRETARTKILVTGGAGFIGSHFVEHLLKNTNWDIVVLDKLSYASSGFDRLKDVFEAMPGKEVFAVHQERLRVFTADFVQPIEPGLKKEIGDVDYIVHIGAETHVDRSIENPEPFVIANVVGTMRMLDFARSQEHLKKFVYFSTDEIFGPAPLGTAYKEWDRYNSTNPYSASKAGGEELCMAYANTYRVPVVVTHTMNVFGERQHPEKFIPMTIKKVQGGDTVVIHSDPMKRVPGSRFWIHARNVASAILFLLEKGEFREKYNVVGEREVNNLEMAEFIAKVLGKPFKYEMVDFHSSRPGHDLRYALDGSKMMNMGWHIPIPFEHALEKTIQWTLANSRWLEI